MVRAGSSHLAQRLIAMDVVAALRSHSAAVSASGSARLSDKHMDRAHRCAPTRSDSLSPPRACRCSATQQTTCSTVKRPRPYQVLDLIVVGGHSNILQVARQRYSAFKAVFQGLGRGRTLEYKFALCQHPLTQFFSDGHRRFLA